MSTTVLPSALNVIAALDHSGSKSGSPTILTEIDAGYRSLTYNPHRRNVTMNVVYNSCLYLNIYELCHDKTCLWDFRQTGLLSYRDKLESGKFIFSKFMCYTIEAGNNKGADQTVQMRRLICTLDVRIWHKAHIKRITKVFTVQKVTLHTQWDSGGSRATEILKSKSVRSTDDVIDVIRTWVRQSQIVTKTLHFHPKVYQKLVIFLIQSNSNLL